MMFVELALAGPWGYEISQLGGRAPRSAHSGRCCSKPIIDSSSCIMTSVSIIVCMIKHHIQLAKTLIILIIIIIIIIIVGPRSANPGWR